MYRPVIPNLWVETPPMGHIIILRGHKNNEIEKMILFLLFVSYIFRPLTIIQA